MKYIPVNKATGERYNAISGEEMAKWMNDQNLKKKFTFEPVEGPKSFATAPAKEPIEAKPIEKK